MYQVLWDRGGIQKHLLSLILSLFLTENANKRPIIIVTFAFIMSYINCNNNYETFF